MQNYAITTPPTTFERPKSNPQQQNKAQTATNISNEQPSQQKTEQQLMGQAQTSLGRTTAAPPANNDTNKIKPSRNSIINTPAAPAAPVTTNIKDDSYIKSKSSNAAEPDAKRPKLDADVITVKPNPPNKTQTTIALTTTTTTTPQTETSTPILPAKKEKEIEKEKKKPKLWKGADVLKIASSQEAHARIHTLADRAVEVDETYRNRPKIKLLLQRYKCALKAGIAPEIFAMRLSSILGLVEEHENATSSSSNNTASTSYPPHHHHQYAYFPHEVVCAFRLFQKDRKRLKREAQKLDIEPSAMCGVASTSTPARSRSTTKQQTKLLQQQPQKKEVVTSSSVLESKGVPAQNNPISAASMLAKNVNVPISTNTNTVPPVTMMIPTKEEFQLRLLQKLRPNSPQAAVHVNMNSASVHVHPQVQVQVAPVTTNMNMNMNTADETVLKGIINDVPLPPSSQP